MATIDYVKPVVIPMLVLPVPAYSDIAKPANDVSEQKGQGLMVDGSLKTRLSL